MFLTRRRILGARLRAALAKAKAEAEHGLAVPLDAAGRAGAALEADAKANEAKHAADLAVASSDAAIQAQAEPATK